MQSNEEITTYMDQTGSLEHDVSALTEGIYLYVITDNQAVISMEKVIIAR